MLPAKFRKRMHNVSVVVEDLPPDQRTGRFEECRIRRFW